MHAIMHFFHNDILLMSSRVTRVATQGKPCERVGIHMNSELGVALLPILETLVLAELLLVHMPCLSQLLLLKWQQTGTVLGIPAWECCQSMDARGVRGNPDAPSNTALGQVAFSLTPSYGTVNVGNK